MTHVSKQQAAALLGCMPMFRCRQCFALQTMFCPADSVLLYTRDHFAVRYWYHVQSLPVEDTALHTVTYSW